MKSNKEIKLNIGAGRTYIPGFVNIDLSEKADVSLDLNCEGLPFDDNSVDLVFTYHLLEHLSDYLFALCEIHRVIKHGGQLLIGVPYVTSTEFNLVNPYHKQHFNEYSFDFFGKMKGSAAELNAIHLRKVWHRFHYFPEFVNEPPEKQEWCRRHYFNVVRKIDFGMLVIKNVDDPLTVSPATEQRFKENFDQCLSMRIQYDALGV